VITAACLKLFPRPADIATALLGVDTPEQALELLARLRRVAGDQVTTFELLPRRAIELTVRHIPGVADPLALGAAWYVLVELGSPNASANLAGLLGEELARAPAAERALLALSGPQSLAMWKLRESVPAAQRLHGASLKHDVSVPISALPRLIADGTALAERLVPEGEVIAYGHAGDGNLHFNVSQREGSDRDRFQGRKTALEDAMFDLVGSLGGSFSAEHGIGRLRTAQFARRCDPVELAVMHSVKRALDPKGLMNPGKVLN
jgi:D-lactate dehydrogenase (cytochrome)